MPLLRRQLTAQRDARRRTQFAAPAPKAPTARRCPVTNAAQAYVQQRRAICDAMPRPTSRPRLLPPPCLIFPTPDAVSARRYAMLDEGVIMPRPPQRRNHAAMFRVRHHAAPNALPAIFSLVHRLRCHGERPSTPPSRYRHMFAALMSERGDMRRRPARERCSSHALISRHRLPAPCRRRRRYR